MTVLNAGGLGIERIALGDFLTNGYILTAEDRPDAAGGGRTVCWVADPGLSPEPLLERLARRRLSPERILLTHGHADHIGGVGALKRAWPKALITFPKGEAGYLRDPVRNLSAMFGMCVTAPEPDQLVSPVEDLAMGRLLWRVLDTSGHTPGGVSYYCPAAGVVLTGDALFAESIGRTDLPASSQQKLLRNIRLNLLSLPDDTLVLPGHGPETTVGEERRHNPFLQGICPED